VPSNSTVRESLAASLFGTGLVAAALFGPGLFAGLFAATVHAAPVPGTGAYVAVQGSPTPTGALPVGGRSRAGTLQYHSVAGKLSASATRSLIVGWL
jgi:hypothetical protein